MNCTICGKATLLGAMLCGPCKAALKRARYVTVQEDMRRPSIIDVRRRPRRPATPPVATTPAPEVVPLVPPIPSRPTERTYSLRPVLIGAAVMALLGMVAYFGQQEPSAQSTDVQIAVPSPAPPIRLASVASETRPAPVAVDVSPPPVALAVTAPLIADAAPPTVLPGSAASKPGIAVGGKRTSPRSGATFATVNGDPPDALNPPPVPEKVAALPMPPPPPAPDRWQTMRDSIALCDRENLINGIICGQKARIQYCEGYWGKVPQCPGPTLNPER